MLIVSAILLGAIVVQKCNTECSMSSIDVMRCKNLSDPNLPYEMYKILIPNIQNINEIAIQNSNLPQLRKLPFPNNKKPSTEYLKTLRINHCELKTIEANAFDEISGIHQLNLSNNRIEDINFLKYIKINSLKELDLSHNLLKTFDGNAIDDTHINYVDISYNCLTLVHLARDFHHTSLTEYKFRNNNIHTVKLDGKFNSLDFENNNIRKIFADGDALVNKLLLSNAISQKGTFRTGNIHTKHQLNLSNNHIQGCEVLKVIIIYGGVYIDLSNNMLKTLNCLPQRDPIYIRISHNNNFTLEKYNNQFITLYLDSCNITNLKPGAFKDMELLEVLDLRNNHLKVLPNDIFPHITRSLNSTILYLQNNLIESIGLDVFSIFPNELHLEHNRIQFIYSGTFLNTKLTHIYLQNNMLQKIYHTAFGGSNINTLVLDNNFNVTFEHKAFFDATIANLSVQNCNLTHLDFNIFQNTTINTFDLSMNPLSKIIQNKNDRLVNISRLTISVNGDIHSNSFSNLNYLKYLTFKHSNISKIHNNSFVGLNNLDTLEFINDTVIENVDVEALNGLFSLTSLDTKVLFKNINKLQCKMFQHLYSIEHLNLSEIGLISISSETFIGLLSLQNLYLNHNNLEKIEVNTFIGLKNLNLLDLSYNRIKNLTQNSFVGLPNLLTLNLTYNEITTLTDGLFKRLENLNTLNLEYNEFSILTRSSFQGLNSLNYLFLKNNLITDIEIGAFQHIPDLKQLYFENNFIRDLKVGVFSNMYQLDKLDFSYNNVSKLLLESFVTLKRLTYLNMGGNNIKKIDTKLFLEYLSKLETVGIGENPWKCEDLGPMVNEFQKKNVKFFTENLDFNRENIDGIGCVDICNYLLCIHDSHGIN